jgi:two-component system, OmpR family, phosphate regulon response regulator PhoB
MTHHILIVEDEPSISELISVNLEHVGYRVQIAFQADEASVLMQDAVPDLMILDWMLPGKSGVQFAKELRAHDRTAGIPILMLTAKSEEADKVQGLDAGADDYMTKPFSTKELLARVKALLRRHSRIPTSETLMVMGALRLDPVTHRVTAEWPGETRREIVVGPTEFKLLQFLMHAPERVHSRAQLLDHVWGHEVYIEERTVDVHVRRLRVALAVARCDAYIETVRGVGYRATRSPQSVRDSDETH